MTLDQWIASADALLDLDAKNALVPHGIGGHARTLLQDALDRALRSEPSEPVAWQPIETAPKDGGLIMLCLYPHRGYNECPRKVGGWWDEKWNIFGGSWKPTHWQRLPDSPTQEPSVP